MSYTFLTISLYVFMRAFETAFRESQQKRWYKKGLMAIALLLLYTSFASIIAFFLPSLWLLGFDPKT